MIRFLRLLALLTCLAGATRANAQADNPETIELGLSTDVISITSDFSGASLTIFGALSNFDPQVLRLGRYDVFVVLEGPLTNIVARRKDRIVGMWINVAAQQFVNIPASYLVASTRQPRDITAQETLTQLGLGIDSVRLQPYDRRQNPGSEDDFRDALRRLKMKSGLFAEFPAGVAFLSQSLFRATLALPANVPVGEHRARAYLFKNGVFVSGANVSLRIQKSGFEQDVYRFAHDRSLLFGIAAVSLSILTGWLGRVFFKRD